jgi:predicted nucleotidyltransferase
MRRLAEPYKKLLDGLLNCLQRAWNGNLVSLVVFGSVARGQSKADSDVDLLLVSREFPVDRLRRQGLFIEVEKTLDVEWLHKAGYYPSFSPLLKTIEEAKHISPLYLDMVEDAIIMYDVGGFFRGVLERLKEGLRKLGARRVMVGSRWYWDLKPTFKHGEEIVIE